MLGGGGRNAGEPGVRSRGAAALRRCQQWPVQPPPPAGRRNALL